ncbi:type II secretion system minor pseudopilin GspK [Glaciecola sp. KUL10]|uniref:type II secretion system minor pseudopilin GspK n=1 Tax=Glaciecola sp. (strain KUL10) TaxID=2161813 RepID=UPI000D9895A8|nr:type II secretion system minor pseudopilin GspK [Glaciecola sp. KUL10]GBL04388.1 type II secretion system protein K [Glaciecola sp. KUL10]
MNKQLSRSKLINASPKRKQKGVALLVIMLIVAIVTVLATEMVGRLQLNMARTTNIKANNQAYWYAVSAEEFARKRLGDLKTLDPSSINLSQPWAQVFAFPLEDGGIQAELIDLHACFNLNSVANPPPPPPSGAGNTPTTGINSEIEAFNRLLQLANAELIDTFTADTVADSLADWIDDDSQLKPFGAEDADYESLQFPYNAANAPMTNASEFRLINGVDISWLSSVMPLICAIPNVTVLKVNINTIKPEHAIVLAAIANISIEDATRLISARPADGYANIADFLSNPEVKNLNDVQKSWLSIKSDYFMLDTKTRYNGSSFNMTSIFNVFDASNVEVISREFRSAK